jgi:dissimilatory sulfite reductase (desulfoviridin) alpha/beta subunit
MSRGSRSSSAAALAARRWSAWWSATSCREADLLPYVEAVLSVYNTLGRRDNKYKARIKITLHETGKAEITRMIEDRFAELRPLFGGNDQALLADIRAAFAPPAFRDAPTDAYDAFAKADPVFRAWADTNLPRTATRTMPSSPSASRRMARRRAMRPADQMRLLADLAETYGHSDLRISHEQNVILPHVHKSDLPRCMRRWCKAGLGTANVGLLSDIIACPGMDYCALATARSIPVAQELATHFEALKLEHEIGPLKIKISGCINACGHHHVGHIGILGLDRAGVENYQITLGGDGTEDAVIGEKTGPGFAYDEVVPAIERILRAYLGLRLEPSETFLQAFRRVGMEPFKTALYGGRRAGCRVTSPSGPVADRVAALNARYRHHSATAVLEHALKDPTWARWRWSRPSGRNRWCCCIWSVVIAPETPVLFVDTRMLFPKRWTTSASWPRSCTFATSARSARSPTRGIRGPGRHAAPVQHRCLLCGAQGGTAGTRAGGLRRLDHRAQAVSERRPRGAISSLKTKAISGSR